MINRQARILLFSLSLLTVGFLPLVSAQGDTTPQEAAPSSDEIKAAMASVASSTDLDEDAKKAAKEAFEQALEALTKAKASGKRADRLEAATGSAPDDLQKIKDELKQPVEEPSIDPGPNPEETALEEGLGRARTKNAALQKILTDLQKQPGLRKKRQEALPELISNTKQSLEALQEELKQAAEESEPKAVSAAKRVRDLARLQAANAKLRALEAESGNLQATGSLLTARIEQAERRSDRSAKIERAWQKALNDFSEAKAKEAHRKAQREKAAAESVHPLVAALAQKNLELTELTQEITRGRAKATKSREQADRIGKDLTGQQEETRKRIKAVGLTEALGFLIRQHRSQLPDPDAYQSKIDDRRDEINETQLQVITAEEELEGLMDLDAAIERDWSTRLAEVPENIRSNVESKLRELLDTRKTNLRSLAADGRDYVDALVALDVAEKGVVTKSAEYAKWIDEYILWIRSAEPIWKADFEEIGASLRWLVSPKNWREAAESANRYLGNHLFVFCLVVAAFLAFLWARWQMLRGLLSRQQRKPLPGSYLPTLKSLTVVALTALLLPTAVWLIGWGLCTEARPASFTWALGAALRKSTLLIFGLSIMARVLIPSGLGQAHFGWPEASVRLARRSVRCLTLGGLPLLIGINIFNNQPEDVWRTGTARLLLIAFLLGTGIVAALVFHPAHGVVAKPAFGEKPKWTYRGRWIWFLLAGLIPLTLALLAAAGYYLTTTALLARLITLFVAGFLLIVTNGLLVRWVTVARRQLARKRAEERRALTEAAQGENAEEAAELAQSPLDLETVDAQSRRLVRHTMVIAWVVGLWLIWGGVLPALTVIGESEVWSIGGEPTTVGDLLLAVIVLVASMLGTRDIPGLLEVTLLQKLPIQPASRYAITTVVRYLLFVIGLVITIGLLGFSWDSIQWLVAAMGVGLGFGLREIVGNFVSGLVILFEHRARVGDTVTVGTVTGVVTKIRVLATTVRDWDRKEFVIPNMDLVTGQLVNWTLSDQVNRLVVPVRVTYDTDTAHARRLLLECANDHPEILEDPAPMATFESFGDSSLGLVLRCFLANTDNRLGVMTDLHETISARFREAGIQIAVPVQDIRIRSSSAEVQPEQAWKPARDAN